jgi:hypothetical protein
LQDDIEGERGRRVRFSRHSLAFDVTVILPASYVWCFRRVPLLACGYWRGIFFFA